MRIPLRIGLATMSIVAVRRRSTAAAAFGRLGAVRALVDAGVDVNEQSARGDTALHETVRNDDARLARLLLSSGARPRINAYGRTPADEAHAWAPDLVPILPDRD
jgi:ankyrin repeat protein